MTDSVQTQKRVVGPYILERKLGEGGMAEVWLARHRNLETTAAIKFLNSSYAGHPEVEARFLDEGKLQARLTQMNARGANILPVFDYMVEDRRSYLVMRYIEGMGLDTRIGNPGRPLAVAEAVGIARDMLGAMGFAHSQGVIHRDIKPSNVLLEEGKRAFLMDFGIALVRNVTTDRRTRVGAMMGTLHYMSPEQITASRDVTPASDIYSFGCVLYEMLTGQTPFDPHNTAPDFEVQRMHIHQAPLPPSSLNPAVSRDLDEITLQCLAKSVADRFADCESVLSRLDARPQRSGTVVIDPLPERGRAGQTRMEDTSAWAASPASSGPGRSASVPAIPLPAPQPGRTTDPPASRNHLSIEDLRRQKQKKRMMAILGGGLAAALVISGGVAAWEHEKSQAEPEPVVVTPPVNTADKSPSNPPPSSTTLTKKPPGAPAGKPPVAVKTVPPKTVDKGSNTVPKQESQAPPAATGPSGSMVWMGSVTENQILTFYPTGQVSSGIVRGTIYEKEPLKIELVPSTMFDVLHKPDASNGWTLALRALNTGDGRVSVHWTVVGQ